MRVMKNSFKTRNPHASPPVLTATLVQSPYPPYTPVKIRTPFFSCVPSRDSRDSCSISVLLPNINERRNLLCYNVFYRFCFWLYSF